MIRRNLFSFSDGFYKPTNQIRGAHNKAEQSSSIKAKKRRSCVRGMAPSVVSVLVTHNVLQEGTAAQTDAVFYTRIVFFFLSLTGQPAECDSGPIPRSAHPHLFWSRRRVRACSRKTVLTHSHRMSSEPFYCKIKRRWQDDSVVSLCLTWKQSSWLKLL